MREFIDEQWPGLVTVAMIGVTWILTAVFIF